MTLVKVCLDLAVLDVISSKPNDDIDARADVSPILWHHLPSPLNPYVSVGPHWVFVRSLLEATIQPDV